MIPNLPQLEAPEWLMNASEKNTHSMPAIKDLLVDSLYYPSSGFDGDPIAYLSGNIYSFIYVDYGFIRSELDNNLLTAGFKGYDTILSVNVEEKDLAPNGWTPIEPKANDGDPNKYQSWIKKPFAHWVVFQRHHDLDDRHGAERFSLLYICAEGVATFQALYHSNRCVPLAVAIIQPGTGFGHNWTDFTKQDRIFARSVLKNPQGVPEYLLYGGAGGREMYQETCWSDYSNKLCFLGNTSIGLWKNTL